MKKSLLIFSAFLLAFMTVPAAYAQPLLQLKLVNGLLTVDADANIKIPVKVKLLKGVKVNQKILEINLRGGVGLKAIVKANVSVNGIPISADNVDIVGSKLRVTLDDNQLNVKSNNRVVVDLTLKLAGLELASVKLCLNLSAKVLAELLEKAEVEVEVTNCKDRGGKGPGEQPGDDEPGEKPGDDEPGEEPGNGDNGDNGNGNNGDNGKGDNGDNGNGNNGGNGNGNNGGNGNGGNGGGGGQLPKTATPYPALTLIGSLLLLAGAGLLRLKAQRG